MNGPRRAQGELTIGVVGPHDLVERIMLSGTAAPGPSLPGPPAPGPFGADALVAHMAQDKKAEGGALTFILARRIGEAFVAKGVETAAARDGENGSRSVTTRN